MEAVVPHFRPPKAVHFKPNLQYNLTLYRKSFNRSRHHHQDEPNQLSQQVSTEGRYSRMRKRKLKTIFK